MRKRFRERMSNKKGFTMVELIVVVVIIMILGAALVPSLLGYVNQARRANVRSDAATILSQLEADYAAIHSGDPEMVSASEWKGSDTNENTIAGVRVTLAQEGISRDAVAGESGSGLGSQDMLYAVYLVDNGQITAFRYNDGEYFATWIRGEDPAWTVEEVEV